MRTQSVNLANFVVHLGPFLMQSSSAMQVMDVFCKAERSGLNNDEYSDKSRRNTYSWIASGRACVVAKYAAAY